MMTNKIFLFHFPSMDWGWVVFFTGGFTSDTRGYIMVLNRKFYFIYVFKSINSKGVTVIDIKSKTQFTNHGIVKTLESVSADRTLPQGSK